MWSEPWWTSPFARLRGLRRAGAGATISLVFALALFPSLALAAQVSGPASAEVGARVTFTATGMRAGTYTLRLVKVLVADNVVAGTDCLADVGHATVAVAGKVRITGVLPTRLACRSAAGPVEGHYTARAGSYLITISRNEAGMPYGGSPFLKRTLRLE